MTAIRALDSAKASAAASGVSKPSGEIDLVTARGKKAAGEIGARLVIRERAHVAEEDLRPAFAALRRFMAARSRSNGAAARVRQTGVIGAHGRVVDADGAGDFAQRRAGADRLDAGLEQFRRP